MHKAGTYTDHNGVQPEHNTLDTMTIHHDSGTCCGGTCCRQSRVGSPQD